MLSAFILAVLVIALGTFLWYGWKKQKFGEHYRRNFLMERNLNRRSFEQKELLRFKESSQRERSECI